MEILKLLLPVVTFFLGVFVTYYFKYRDNSRQIIKENIDEILNISERWYNELSILAVLTECEKDNEVLEAAFQKYNKQSLFLTRYTAAIEKLRKYSHLKDFIVTAESFRNKLCVPIYIMVNENEPLDDEINFQKILKPYYEINRSSDDFTPMMCGSLFVRDALFWDERKNKLNQIKPRKLILSTPRNLVSNSDSQIEELNLSDSKTLGGIKCQMQKIHFESAKIKF